MKNKILVLIFILPNNAVCVIYCVHVSHTPSVAQDSLRDHFIIGCKTISNIPSVRLKVS